MSGEDVQATDLVRLTDHIRCVVPAMGPDLAERIAKSLTDYVAAVRAEGWQAAYDDLHETARLTGPEVVDLVTAAVAAARADERERMHAFLLRDDVRRLMAQEYLCDFHDYMGQDLTRHAQGMAAAVRAAFARDYPPGSRATEGEASA